MNNVALQNKEIVSLNVYSSGLVKIFKHFKDLLKKNIGLKITEKSKFEYILIRKYDVYICTRVFITKIKNHLNTVSLSNVNKDIWIPLNIFFDMNLSDKNNVIDINIDEEYVIYKSKKGNLLKEYIDIFPDMKTIVSKNTYCKQYKLEQIQIENTYYKLDMYDTFKHDNTYVFYNKDLNKYIVTKRLVIDLIKSYSEKYLQTNYFDFILDISDKKRELSTEILIMKNQLMETILSYPDFDNEKILKWLGINK